MAALAFVAWNVATYDVAAWQADFKHLKGELAQRYANLDWIVEHRHVDLKALDAETSAAIDNAHSSFLAAFDDPRAVEHAPAEAALPSGATAESVVASCEAAGYETYNYGFRFPFADLPGWTIVGDGRFPTGLAGELGVLRIASSPKPTISTFANPYFATASPIATYNSPCAQSCKPN